MAEVAALAKARGASVHTDAAQSVGKVPVDVRQLNVDLLSVAGHKLYAPKGVEPDKTVGSVRLTLGRSTTRADVIAAAEALWRAWALVCAATG